MICDAEIIPEDELIRLASEVIGGEVTEDAVRDKITVIRAEENRTLVFCLTNRKQTVKQWRKYEIRHVRTEERRQAVSRKNSGWKMTEEQRMKQSERMKEYWRDCKFPEEQRQIQSEKMKACWDDREASEEHRQKVSRRMKEMRAKESGKGEENG